MFAYLTEPSIYNPKMIIVVRCALCQVLQLSLQGVAIALVLLHLAPYRLLLETLYGEHVLARLLSRLRRLVNYWNLGNLACREGKAYLEIILPRHIGIYMRLVGSIYRCGLPLERRRRAIISSWPFPFLHLDKGR